MQREPLRPCACMYSSYNKRALRTILTYGNSFAGALPMPHFTEAPLEEASHLGTTQ